MRTFLGKWRIYETLVMPANAGDVQRKETRRAFYAGGQAMLHAIMQNVSEGEEITAADIQLLHELNAEITAFGDDIQAGRA